MNIDFMPVSVKLLATFLLAVLFPGLFIFQPYRGQALKTISKLEEPFIEYAQGKWMLSPENCAHPNPADYRLEVKGKQFVTTVGNKTQYRRVIEGFQQEPSTLLPSFIVTFQQMEPRLHDGWIHHFKNRLTYDPDLHEVAIINKYSIYYQDMMKIMKSDILSKSGSRTPAGNNENYLVLWRCSNHA